MENTIDVTTAIEKIQELPKDIQYKLLQQIEILHHSYKTIRSLEVNSNENEPIIVVGENGNIKEVDGEIIPVGKYKLIKIEEDDLILSEELKNELDSILENHEKNPNRGYTWEEAMEIIGVKV